MWAREIRCPEDTLVLTKAIGLTWLRSSKQAQRGFCSECGSSLFYKRDETPSIAIGAGTLDGETGVTTVKHIFVKDKGDYYDLGDDCEQLETW